MNMIGCKCLNIIIETEVNKFSIVENDQLGLTTEEMEDNFFQNKNLRQVEKLDNINRSLPGLVETREVGSWIIHYCINCKVHTHAVHKQKGASCVLVNSNLLSSDSIKKLKNSANFSKVYGIVIDTSQFVDENEEIFYPNKIEPIVKGFKDTLTEAMSKEAALVEEKVKKFAEEQYNLLDQFRERLFNEEQTLIRTLYTHFSSKKEIENVNNGKVIEVPNRAFSNIKDSPEKKSSQPVASSQLKHTPKRQKSTPAQNNYDSEFLFDLDGIDNQSVEDENDIESEEDEVTHMSMKENRYHTRTRTSSIKFAKSLPMDIPIFMRPKNDEEPDLEEDIQEPLEDIDIAASIKKLAKSVHGGGIFGELPRPRFSTQL